MFKKFCVLKRSPKNDTTLRFFAKDLLDKSDKLTMMWKATDNYKKDRCGPTTPVVKEVPLPPEKSCSKHRHKEIQYMDIRCKTAIVTGAAKGLALEMVKGLLNEGALNVFIADADRKKGEDTANALNGAAKDKRVHAICCNVTSNLSFEIMLQQVISKCRQIDILVNCVSTFDETPDCWHGTVDTNLISAVRGTILGYHYMSKNQSSKLPRGGCILNISAYNSLINFPTTPVYSTCAAGINGLSSSFGSQKHFEKTGIRCIAVCPGFTESFNMQDFGKNHFDPQWAAHSATQSKTQPGSAVAKVAMQVIKYGVTGCIYAVNEGKCFRYVMPDYPKLLKHESFLT